MDLIDSIIKTTMQILCDEGFKSIKKSYILEKEEIVIQVKPERSRFNNILLKVFWFNLNIYLTKKSKSSETRKIALSTRMGLLWGDPHSTYAIRNNESIESLKKEIKADIEGYFLQFVKTIKNIEDLSGFINKYDLPDGKNPFAFSFAIALSENGRFELSKIYFEKSLGLKEIIKKTALFYGVEIKL